MVSINQLADMITAISGKRITKRHIAGPLGVRGRNSDNRLIRQALGWAPSQPLTAGLEITYDWVDAQANARRRKAPAWPPLKAVPAAPVAANAAPAMHYAATGD
jgi:hypothetical protein